MSRTWLENNKSVRCQLIQLTFSNALKPVAKRIWTSDPSLRRRVLYPAELWRHMPQTLDFTGFLGFFPSAIYKIINSSSNCQSTDFFDLVTLDRSPIWGMPRLSLRRRVLYPAELYGHIWLWNISNTSKSFTTIILLYLFWNYKN